MSEPEIRQASEADVERMEMMATPFIDSLQSLPTNEAMKLMVYITARCFLDMEVKPGFTLVSGFDMWAKSVRVTIERNEALHHQASTH